jgi:hypothetical protein
MSNTVKESLDKILDLLKDADNIDILIKQIETELKTHNLDFDKKQQLLEKRAEYDKQLEELEEELEYLAFW